RGGCGVEGECRRRGAGEIGADPAVGVEVEVVEGIGRELQPQARGRLGAVVVEPEAAGAQVAAAGPGAAGALGRGANPRGDSHAQDIVAGTAAVADESE